MSPLLLAVLSLNLHGYHPQQESPRFAQDRKGTMTQTSSHIFYFSKEEIIRGHARRLDNLAKDLIQIKPDVAFFQEVSAGSPDGQKTCDDFYRQYPQESPWENSAIRLNRRLNNGGMDYQLLLACRGNIGWITDPNTFSEQRILDKSKNVIFDFNQNPYPNGILIEGFATLISKKWEVLENKVWDIPYSFKNDRFVFQTVAVKYAKESNGKWYLFVNLHAAHKVAHFEQAVAMRKALSEYIDQMHSKWSSSFSGMVVAGDFNAVNYRPLSRKGFEEVSMVPFEIFHQGEFDYSLNVTRFDDLMQKLYELNAAPYKSWASISDKTEARQRINSAVNTFIDWQKKYCYVGDDCFLQDVLDKVHPDTTTLYTDRIDYIFTSPVISPLEAKMIYTTNSWEGTDGTSDHPGIIARLGIRN